MRFVSPSSRLVVATVAIAVVALALIGFRSAPGWRGNPSPATPPTALGATPSLAATAVPSSNAATAGQPATALPGTANPLATWPTQPTPKSVSCNPTDQDQYVYNPNRLQVAAACIHVTGTVAAVRQEADGDLHLLLSLDPPYIYLLRPANQGEELGDLVVEPVCVRSVTQLDAEATCTADPDPLNPPFPIAGERVWMEGRYVFDLEHGGWAELHPLYRWGDG